MKQLFFIFILLLIVFQQSIYSQEYCFTPTFSSGNSNTLSNSNLIVTAPVTLRVYFHVVRRSDKTGGYLPNQVEESLNILQGHFNPHGVFFAWDGCINYINNNIYFNATEKETLNELFMIDSHADGIDLYLNLNDSFRGGAANGLGPEAATALWVSGIWDGPTALNSTVSHEMGHVFFLYHTHHGCEGDGTWEDLDGSNCATAGDEVCATDRDPGINFNVNSNCEWLGFASGCFNPDLPPQDFDSYNPDTKNIMSYSQPNCRTEFKADEGDKEGQGTRMLNKIGEFQHLQDCIISAPFTMDCECLPADVLISQNTVFDQEIHISGDLIILNGAELTITSTVYFNYGYGIKIEENSKLLLNGATLSSCENHWKGIEVFSGELEASDSYILNADKGIKARNGTTLNLVNNEISGNSGLIGVYLLQQVNLIQFQDMKIDDYFFGIYGYSNAGFYDFSHAEIVNTHYGIYLRNSYAYINDCDITASRYGIYLQACDESIISECHIGFKDYGIAARNTNNLYIDGNTIGLDDQTGRTAIGLLNCQSVDITANSAIYASQFGIRAFQSNVVIEGNDINVQGQNNKVGGGIQLTSNVGSVINKNLITANHSSFGIESVIGQNNTISHNEVSVFSTVSTRTAAIRTMGGMSESIDNNIIDGLANVTGIIAQNSTDNSYECNEINNTVDGLAIFYNSAGQDIRGNKFLGSDFDLSIRSVIGQQSYAGNEFVNGSARAIGLDIDEIENSRFFVNSTFLNHMPSDPVPVNDWFVNDPNENGYYDDCGAPGPFVKFYDNEDKLSDYFDAVKLLEDEQPNVFNTKMYHLLKYEQTKVNYTLPDYIRQDVVITDLCSLQELADISSRLEALIQSNADLNGDSQSHLSNIQILALELLSQGTDLNDLSEPLSQLTLDIEDRLIADSLSLLDMKGDLENIDCTDNYTEMWKAIYTMYIDFIQTGEVSEKYQKDLVEYSKACSDQYGDVIHIARVMANTFDDTYFDVYDDCMKDEDKRFKLEPAISNSLAAFLQPNPSKGIIVLHTEYEMTGTIKVIDLTGKVVYTATMINENQHQLNLNLNEGLYFIYLTSKSGEVFSEKVIITK